MIDNISISDKIRTGNYGIYPTASIGTQLTSGVAVWANGDYTEIIPVNTITTPYYVFGLYLRAISSTRTYQVTIAKGLALSEIDIIQAPMRGGINNSVSVCLPVPIVVPANTRISGKSADSAGSGDIRVKIIYRV